jgi:hypothetical protein
LSFLFRCGPTATSNPDSPWSSYTIPNPFYCFTFLLLLFASFLPAIWQTIITSSLGRYHPGIQTARDYPAAPIPALILQTAGCLKGKTQNDLLQALHHRSQFILSNLTFSNRKSQKKRRKRHGFYRSNAKAKP